MSAIAPEGDTGTRSTMDSPDKPVRDAHSTLTSDTTIGSGPQSYRREAARLFRFLGRPITMWLVIGAIGSLTLAMIELVISLFLQLFLQNIGILSRSLQSVGVLRYVHLSASGVLVGLLVIAVIRAVGQFLVSQGSSQSQELMNARLRRLAIYEILLHPERRLVPSAVVHARLSDTFIRTAQFCFYAGSFLAFALQSVLLVAVMFGTAAREAGIALAGFVMVGAGVALINRRIRRVAGLIPKEQLHLTESVQRVARNSVLIRALRTQQLEYGRFRTSVDNYTRHAMKTWSLNNLATALTPFFGLLLVIAVITISLRTFHTPSLTLLSFLYLFIRFVQSVAASVSFWSMLNTYWPQFSESYSYFNTFAPGEIDVALGDLTVAPVGRSAGPNASLPKAPELEICNVDFRYSGNGVDVINDLSFAARSGSQLAIIGPSGCGKSTLLALMLGLLEPTRGEIRVSGRRAREYFDDLATQVGYVGAEPFLIAGSVRDNLVYGLAHNASDADLWKALDEASMLSTVEQLPGQLEYRIAEDGSGLSAGQKQRLCLARAFARKPQVLILDEVSANLDDATEQEIVRTLDALRGHVTTIIVSHRRGLIRHSDCVLDLGPVKPLEGNPADAVAV